MSMHTQQGQSGRPLTGAMVLAMLLAFFGIVIAVNLVMFRLASSTFSGLEERNAYTAGISHNRALLAAKAQDECPEHLRVAPYNGSAHAMYMCAHAPLAKT